MLFNEHKRSRHSFEVLVVGFCVFSGAVQVFADRAPSNVERAIGPVFQSTWSWCMLVAGVLALTGIIIKNEVTGSYIELSGMCGLSFGNLVYGMTVILQNPIGSYAGPITIGISLASFWRAGRLSRALWYEHKNPGREKLIREVRQRLVSSVEKEARQIIENSEDLGQAVEGARQIIEDSKDLGGE